MCVHNFFAQDFQCHKVILSACSPVFERMFNGHFKEANMGPDEPIRLDRIDPDVFESAMRWENKCIFEHAHIIYMYINNFLIIFNILLLIVKDHDFS